MISRSSLIFDPTEESWGMDSEELIDVARTMAGGEHFYKHGDVVLADDRGNPIGLYVGEGKINVASIDGKPPVVIKYNVPAAVNAQIVEVVALMVQTLMQELNITQDEAARKLRWATYVLEG